MKVKIQKTNKEINLTKNKFINSGGEGSIYAYRGTAFKIYQNPKASKVIFILH